jgi:hypothetical protein
MRTTNWKTFLGIVVVILAAPQIAKLLANFSNEREAQRNNTQAGVISEIRTIVSSEPSYGITPSQLDMAVLEAFERDAKTKIENRVISQTGVKNFELNTSAVYVGVGDKKLAVIKLQGSGNFKAVMLAGIVNNEFKRVGCMWQSSTPVPLTSGPCAETVKETFGFYPDNRE